MVVCDTYSCWPFPMAATMSTAVMISWPWLTLIGDKGFAGRDFEDLVTAGFGLRLVRPDGAMRRPGTGHRLDPAVDRVGQRHPQGRPG